MCYRLRIPLTLGDGYVHDHHTFPEDLKSRVAEAAKRSGTTTHAFILDAIAEKTKQEGLRAAFDAVAEDRYARIVATGQTIPWQEMRSYLEEHLAGQ